MRRIGTSLVVAALLLVSACGGSETTGDEPPSSVSADGFQPVGVIGSGRAAQASSATGTGTLVATTIGVNLVDPAGGTTSLPTTIDAPANEVVMSPDGRRGLVSAYDRSELWSLESAPTMLAEFAGPTTAAFSADGSTLVTATPTQLASTTLSDSEPARPLADAPEGTQFGEVTMTPDATLVAAPVSGDGADLVTYSDAAGAVFVDAFADPLTKIDHAVMTRDGSHVIMATSTGDPFAGRLASWNTMTGGLDWDIELGSAGLRTLWAVGADGRALVAGDTALRLIGTDGAVVAEWSYDDRGAPTSITATLAGYAIASPTAGVLFTDLDGTPRTAPVAAGTPMADVETLTADDGIVAVDTTGTVSVWRSDGTLISETSAYRSSAINDVAISEDGMSLAFASTDGTVTVTPADGTGTPTTLVHPEGNVDDVAFSPAGTQVVTGVGKRLSDISFDDTISIWSLADGTRTATFGGEGEDVNGCANFRNSVEYSPDGTLFAAASHDFTVSIHRGDTGELVTTLPAHLSTVLDLEFSPNGDRLVTSSDDGAVRVWDVGSYQMLSEYVGPPGGYWSLAFLPDGNSLVVSDLTGALHRLDVATGAETLAFSGTTSRTGRIAVSPDGTLVAAPSDGNSVGIWSSTTGELLAQMEGHSAPVTSAAFSPDGTRLYTGSGDATVRIWQIA